jgi:hypothetical protein
VHDLTMGDMELLADQLMIGHVFWFRHVEEGEEGEERDGQATHEKGEEALRGQWRVNRRIYVGATWVKSGERPSVDICS